MSIPIGLCPGSWRAVFIITTLGTSYWSSGDMLGAMAAPFAASTFPSGQRPRDLVGVDARTDEDPPLRSIDSGEGSRADAVIYGPDYVHRRQ
jgi:hypothetical protein